MRKIAQNADQVKNDEVTQLHGVLVTPRFNRFIDKSLPTYDILMSLKPDLKEITEIPERI